MNLQKKLKEILKSTEDGWTDIIQELVEGKALNSRIMSASPYNVEVGTVVFETLIKDLRQLFSQALKQVEEETREKVYRECMRNKTDFSNAVEPTEKPMEDWEERFDKMWFAPKNETTLMNWEGIMSAKWEVDLKDELAKNVIKPFIKDLLKEQDRKKSN